MKDDHSENCWVASLAAAPERELALDALQKIRAGGEKLGIGSLDATTLAVIEHTIAAKKNLLLAIPRGRHEFALTCGLYLQIARLVGREQRQPAALDFLGPIVIIGLDTLVQERLAGLYFQGISLGGLEPSRINHAGLPVNRQGQPSPTRRGGEDRRVLYLNTRVGWPRLDTGDRRAGVVVIDKTTFGSQEILETAIGWCRDHNPRTVIVITDVGDADATDTLDRTKLDFRSWWLTWPQIGHIGCCAESEKSGPDGGVASDLRSPLSLGRLGLIHSDTQRQGRLVAPRTTPSDPIHGVVAVECQAAEINELLHRCWLLLSRAGPPAEWPTPVIAVRKLLNGLARLPCSVSEYNRWAAIDYRTTSLASLENKVRDASANQFQGSWLVLRETVWQELRYLALDLHDRIAHENPKRFAMADVLSWVRQEWPSASVIVRAPSEAMGQALQEDLNEFGISLPHANGRLHWTTENHRGAWSRGKVIAIHPGAIAPWQLSRWAGGEAATHLHLGYRYEISMLQYRVRQLEHRLIAGTAASLLDFGLVDLQTLESGAEIPVIRTFSADAAGALQRKEIALDVDISLLYDDIDPIIGSEQRQVAARAATGELRPIFLSPGKAAWWVRPDATIEVLMGRTLKWRPVDELRPGDHVVVPRGEGREALFTRLVRVTHRDDPDMASFEVFLGRWRTACMTFYTAAGSNWREAEVLLRRRGSTIGWQAIRSWGLGTVIGPDDPEDIKRIGEAIEDAFVTSQAVRLNHIMTETRGLHVRLGNLISAALAETVEGAGRHLERLCKILKTNVADLLEEFDVRVVLRVGPIEVADMSRVGQVTAS